jgi:hypothetical protein
MHFQKIWFNGETVRLSYTDKNDDASLAVEEAGEDPSPAFKAALQAFSGYCVWVWTAPRSGIRLSRSAASRSSGRRISRVESSQRRSTHAVARGMART